MNALESSPIIRHLNAGDAVAYQALRLLALQDAPSAFTASYEDEVIRTIEEVAQRIAPPADGSVRMYGVFCANELVGIAGLLHPQRRKLRHCTELVGMFVAPPFRKYKLGRQLLEFVLSEAQSTAGVKQIKLSVNATNVAAKTLYQSVGFVLYGTEPQAICVDGQLFDIEHYQLAW